MHVIGGQMDCPVLIPALAVGLTDSGDVQLSEAINMGDGEVTIAPRARVLEFDEELQLRINRLTAIAGDAIDNVRALIKAGRPFDASPVSGRPIGFTR